MGNNQSLPLCNFEYIRNKSEQTLLINTLNSDNQSCLIEGTLEINEEEEKINEILKHKTKTNVILYGRNCHDESVIKKYKQFQQYGIFQLHIYIGGLFEWLLLQETYGSMHFPTTNSEIDILKYK